MSFTNTRDLVPPTPYVLINNQQKTNGEANIDNSPVLIKCEEKEDSRVIKRRIEDSNIKPYETLRNIILKNNCVTSYNKEEKRDKIFNERLELIDNIIKAENEFIEILKNSIIEREKNDKRRKEYWLIIDCIKLKSKVAVNGKKGFEYLVTYKILIRSLIIGILLLGNNSDVILGINNNVLKLLQDFLMNLSNRRWLDNDFYLELLFIEKFLFENEMEIDRNNFSFWQCSYDEELPTYGVLYKREVNGIPEELCPRCKKSNEDWEHIWTCEANEIEVKWELLRGVYNNNFNKISKRKDYKSVIEDLWCFCYEKIRSRIWIKRCEIVAEIEKKEVPVLVLSSSFLALDIDSMFRLGNLKRNGSFSTWYGSELRNKMLSFANVVKLECFLLFKRETSNDSSEELRNSGFQTVQVGNFEVINLKWFKCFGSVLRK
ncbi:hypothetical protein RhiirA4_474637 [Rhizophagus irregularis]|uniref:Uncharacterized protein n=1 Tax=Rhizophagus irregularis TaxID=588596 RepID=A0A2I1H8T5_9GLOM|nr:hypothetical protein RhiirA4_474637 [Rhizophagus irregularis]